MNLGNVFVMTFLAAATFLCGSICIIFAATLGEGESLIELIFWPTFGFLGFAVMLAEAWNSHVYCAIATVPLYEQK